MDWYVSVYSLAAIGSDIVHTPTLLQDLRYNIGTFMKKTVRLHVIV